MFEKYCTIKSCHCVYAWECQTDSDCEDEAKLIYKMLEEGHINISDGI